MSDLKDLVERLTEELDSRQWEFNGNPHDYSYCLSCGAFYRRWEFLVHKDGCKLKALLDEAKAFTQPLTDPVSEP